VRLKIAPFSFGFPGAFSFQKEKAAVGVHRSIWLARTLSVFAQQIRCVFLWVPGSLSFRKERKDAVSKLSYGRI